MVYSNPMTGLTALEAIITLCLIGILIGVVIPKYQRLALEAQETALRSELVNIRMSIRLFRLSIGRNPAGLDELMEKEVMLPARVGSDAFTGSIFKHKYLMHNAVDEEGNILDAFGNRFQYDPKTGEVRTTTKGYEKW